MKAKPVICILALLSSGTASYSLATAGISVGSGMGSVRHDFTNSGTDEALDYVAPGLFIDGELDWGNYYLNMSLAMLMAPLSVMLGGNEVDLADYSMNSAADFTAIGIGYLYPLSDRVKIGGALGFHVSSIMLSPPNDELDLLTLEGYYGTIGLSLNPRLRFVVNESINCTITVPIAFDFSPMSDEVVTMEGPTGNTSPAIVRPDTLVPRFTGMSAGVYISVGYFFDMPY